MYDWYEVVVRRGLIQSYLCHPLIDKRLKKENRLSSYGQEISLAILLNIAFRAHLQNTLRPQRRGACSGAAMILAATAAVSCILVWRVNSVEMALLAWSASCSSVKGWVASGGKRGSDPTPVVYRSSLSVLRHCLNAARDSGTSPINIVSSERREIGRYRPHGRVSIRAGRHPY
jgi:hypothetical protein